MKTLERKDYSRGWVPDADAINASKDCLLRADNLVQDEQGIWSLRKGSAILYTLAGAPDVHSLFSTVLNGTRYRLAGGGNDVFSNGASLGLTVAGSGDIAFGSNAGQILMARSTSKKKFNGTTVRNWGIAKPANKPTIAGIAPDYKVYATCDTGESPGFLATSGSIVQADGHDGTSGSAVEITPDPDTAGAVATKTFATDQDFTVYVGGETGIDEDLIDFYVYITDPYKIRSMNLAIDVNGGTFVDDYFVYEYINETTQYVTPDPIALPVGGDNSNNPPNHSDYLNQQGQAVSVYANVFQAGWNHFTIARGNFTRVGITTAKGWNTVRAIRLSYVADEPGPAAVVRLDNIQVIGGNLRPLTGKYRYYAVPVYNSGEYLGKGITSDASDEIELKAQAAAVSLDTGTLDTQVNEVWIFRSGGNLDQPYRVYVYTHTAPVTGTIAIDDTMSDNDAMILNIPLEIDCANPPDDIIGIVGPYYFRTLCLTKTQVCPSRRNNPDSFALGQAIKVADQTETPFWIKAALGGVYVGTSKDIYRLDGDGAEMPDGTINFSLKNVNVGNPPISEAVAQEGNALVYLASDGWRAFTGASSEPIAGDTSTLWLGTSWSRHGVDYINIATGRFRATIAKSVLIGLTPEAGDTTSTVRLYKYKFQSQRWYRHTYLISWRSITSERDGTVIAGDNAGHVWQLETGNQDNLVDIPVVLWTPYDNDGAPHNLKNAGDLVVSIDPYLGTPAIAIWLDELAAASKTVTLTGAGSSVYASKVDDLPAFRQAQLRVTGNFSTFKWRGFALRYFPLPESVKVWELGELDLGEEYVWIRRIDIKTRATANLSLVLSFGDVALTAKTVTVTANKTNIYPTGYGRGVSGRQPRIVFNCANGDFAPYWAEVWYRISGGVTEKKRFKVQ